MSYKESQGNITSNKVHSHHDLTATFPPTTMQKIIGKADPAAPLQPESHSFSKSPRRAKILTNLPHRLRLEWSTAAVFGKLRATTTSSMLEFNQKAATERCSATCCTSERCSYLKLVCYSYTWGYSISQAAMSMVCERLGWRERPLPSLTSCTICSLWSPLKRSWVLTLVPSPCKEAALQ